MDYLLKSKIFDHAQVTALFISIIFFVMFIVSCLVFNDNQTELKAPFKKVLKRYFIYLVNFLKHKQVLGLLILFFLNGIIIGLIGQYFAHYISKLDYQNLDSLLVFEICTYSLLFIILIITGAFINHANIKKLNYLLLVISTILLINIVFIILDSQNDALNKLLIISYACFCVFVFMILLIDYLRVFKSHRLGLMMILGYILYLFGAIMSQWVDIIFLNIKTPLYFAISMLFIFLYFRKHYLK